MSPENIIAALGLERIASAPGFIADPKAGTLTNAQGGRAASLPGGLLRGLQFVLERERAGAWARVMHQCGVACGKGFGTSLDRRLATLQAPPLASLSLQVTTDILARLFALHAWGVLQVNLSDVDAHGIVVAEVEQDLIAGAQHGTDGASDPFAAGVLQGYYQYLTGQTLSCAELTCAGADKLTFVVTTPNQLAPLASDIGRKPPAEIVARLKG